MDAADDEGVSGAAGMSETEILKLSQCWGELRERDTFNLLALERAVHQVTHHRRTCYFLLLAVLNYNSGKKSD